MFQKSLAVFLILSGLLAAAGYKNFNWGMSSAETRSSVADLRQNNTGAPPLDEFYVLGKQLFPSLMNFRQEQTDVKMFAADKKRTAYYSSDQKLMFYFEDDRLVGVAVDFDGQDPYRELANKYGARTRTRFLRGNNYSYDGCIWTTPERVIFYSGHVLPPVFGNVYYFAPDWLRAMQTRLKNQSAQDTRID